jgi:hypothetical protein
MEPIVTRIVTKFPAIYGTIKFTITYTRPSRLNNRSVSITETSHIKTETEHNYGNAEAQNLLRYTAAFLIECRPTFQRCMLPPLSGKRCLGLPCRAKSPQTLDQAGLMTKFSILRQ